MKCLLSERKARLFAVACCRRLWHLFRHPDATNSVEVAERFVEGLGTREELQGAEELAMWAGDDASWRSMQAAAAFWPAAAPALREGLMAALSAVQEVGGGSSRTSHNAT
jgi:hypothetical protein